MAHHHTRCPGNCPSHCMEGGPSRGLHADLMHQVLQTLMTPLPPVTFPATGTLVEEQDKFLQVCNSSEEGNLSHSATHDTQLAFNICTIICFLVLSSEATCSGILRLGFTLLHSHALQRGDTFKAIPELQGFCTLHIHDIIIALKCSKALASSRVINGAQHFLDKPSGRIWNCLF